jgi:hypothetical protein
LPDTFEIPVNRTLSPEERRLIEWLIAHGNEGAQNYASQLDQLSVVAHCSCGCPTVDLGFGGATKRTIGPSHVLADFVGIAPEGVEVGIILHAREGKLSELEIYPIGETEEPFHMPPLETLKPF